MGRKANPRAIRNLIPDNALNKETRLVPERRFSESPWAKEFNKSATQPMFHRKRRKR
jgi:hypothetical protein